MATLIIYYSRTGTTRVLVDTLATDLSADVEELRCNRRWTGRWGFVRACFESWRGSLPEIESLRHLVAHYDTVVIAGPIWVSNPSTPLRSFLQSQRALLPRVAFLLTHGGSGAERSLREMERISGQVPIAALVLKESDVKQKSYRARLSAFALKLRLPALTRREAPASATHV